MIGEPGADSSRAEGAARVEHGGPKGALDPRTPAGVAHIARLSRLAMSPAELEVMAGHMSKILDAVSALDRLDTAGVKAGLHDEAATELRPDVVATSLGADEALRNAPRKQPAGFEVPAVIAE